MLDFADCVFRWCNSVPWESQLLDIPTEVGIESFVGKEVLSSRVPLWETQTCLCWKQLTKPSVSVFKPDGQKSGGKWKRSENKDFWSQQDKMMTRTAVSLSLISVVKYEKLSDLTTTRICRHHFQSSKTCSVSVSGCQRCLAFTDHCSLLQWHFRYEPH